ncbi:sarcosine oxidase subunit alpha family protein [Rhizobium leguminosarum]|uniref:sarcosine oxidase subunit alpha family protein n=1 Tax=Rhizobium leguminosarum TaxID=384 RepID=UPI00143F7934|nr:sarcosine oxidase subunit alpha family protein [Rhizobium leguminosarum]NKL21270.1 sarcosine oxidase subunit alpha family protein [Rhizobium leguminosarum bv. viciae]NKL56776.1 sarcosine oxidase subunit alpha family protein [Rhizobium leguminosarum bv. viciae]
MTAWRTEQGTALDRSKQIRFQFDGLTVDGFEGDTIASALMASGIEVIARSFKYHRPRGLWGVGVEEPNALVDIAGTSGRPNARATTTPAASGLSVRSVNAHPSAASDRSSFIDRFSRFIPAAFYYKTFMFPDWHLFEPRIRAMAGLGKLDVSNSGPPAAEQINHFCDLLVVGAGPAGISAALAASEHGLKVVLCDENPHAGGSLLFRDGSIDGHDGLEWARRSIELLRKRGAHVLLNTTAFGIYDHLMAGLNERGAKEKADRLWRVRPKRIVLATGAIERPLPFANNDLPGIMSAEAALAYLRRFGVAAGRDIVVASNNSLAAETAQALAQAGCKVTLVDYRESPNVKLDGVSVVSGKSVVRAVGRNRVESVELSDGSTLSLDALLVSGGFTPTVHLYGQVQGKLKWRDDILAFVPGTPVEHVAVVGAANGDFSLSAVLSSARRAIDDQPEAPAVASDQDMELGIVAHWPKPKFKGRVWIDLQNDVTAKDIELAARENFISVEHLKRYTTLGMATDQGKTSNVNGLALMAELTGRRIPEVGTTTYRPPYTPVPFTSLAGVRGGPLMNPVRRLPIETEHRESGATFQEYGGWLRPAYYGSKERQREIAREARQARETVALFDGSPLGKIEVIGPDAAAFMDFVYYNTMSTLKPGRCRYGFILGESGIVYDDGVLVRLEEDRFIVSCSSSHVAGVHALLEEWRQDQFDKNRIFIHNATAETATLTVTGPLSKALLEKVGLGLSLDDEHLPHMATAWGKYCGLPVRVTRVSFTGDRSYEISVRADQAAALWTSLRSIGKGFDATLLGVEALMILRAEKGYIIIGKDSDGMCRPMDFGLTAPLQKKRPEFIGKRSLLMDEAQRADRNQFVGLEVLDELGALPTGAHGVDRSSGQTRSIGYVTSSYLSPTLNKPIALGLIERGLSRHGEVIELQHLGQIRKARIVSPCALDPEGARLNA